MLLARGLIEGPRQIEIAFCRIFDALHHDGGNKTLLLGL
jgi:hypothetical protein